MHFSNHITQTSFLRKPMFSVMLHPKEQFSLYLTFIPRGHSHPLVSVLLCRAGLYQRQETSCFPRRLTSGSGFSWAGRKCRGKAVGSSRGSSQWDAHSQRSCLGPLWPLLFPRWALGGLLLSSRWFCLRWVRDILGVPCACQTP